MGCNDRRHLPNVFHLKVYVAIPSFTMDGLDPSTQPASVGEPNYVCAIPKRVIGRVDTRPLGGRPGGRPWRIFYCIRCACPDGAWSLPSISTTSDVTANGACGRLASEASDDVPLAE